MCTIPVCTTIDKIMLQKDSQCVQFYEYNIGKSYSFFVIIIEFSNVHRVDHYLYEFCLVI